MVLPIIVYEGIADIFLGYFGNIFNDLMIMVFLLVGVILGIIFRPGWTNAVMKISPTEHRFEEFSIKNESAVSIECDDKKGMPPHRFIKLYPGYIGRTGRFVKRQITRYIGKEGTAYTWKMNDVDEFVKVPGGLATALKTIWGNDVYDQIPDEPRQALENTTNLMVTVDLTEGLTPEGFRSISEEDIKREEDRQAANTLWQGKLQQVKGELVRTIIIGIAGFGIACALQIIGVLRI